MKKSAILLLMTVVFICCTVLSCCSVTPSSKKPTENVQPTAQPQQSSTEQEQITDTQWKVYETTSSLLSERQKKIFQKATSSYENRKFEPVAIISQQVVAGVNYAYLCQGRTLKENPIKTWDIVTVYEDLDGDVSLYSVNTIDLANIKILSEKPNEKGLAGIFKATAVDKGCDIDETIQPLIKQALASSKREYTFVAVLGTQNDNGKNYKFFVQQDDTENVINCILTVNVTPDGKATLSENYLFDIDSYIGDEN